MKDQGNFHSIFKVVLLINKNLIPFFVTYVGEICIHISNLLATCLNFVTHTF